jgi:archaea-specific DNA-binding protein
MTEMPQQGPMSADRGTFRPRTPIPPDTILIGKKPVMAYATAVMMHFSSGAKELTIKARGRAISTAVDVIEVVRRRFFEGKLTVSSVIIGTEVIGEGGDTRNVSTIEIKVQKP